MRRGVNEMPEPFDVMPEHADDPLMSWRDGDDVLRCLAYNVRREGSCDAPLNERQEGPRAFEHGDYNKE